MAIPDGWIAREWLRAIYLLLALAMTFPLVLHLRSSVPSGAADLWQNYWNFWWWKKSLLELHVHPYWTSYLFHPSGTSLVFYTHSPFNMLVSLPVNVLLGPAAAYDFCVVLALWLSGFGTHLLVRDLTGDSRGAYLAGIVFAFFPQHLEQTLEHLNLFSTQFMPLAVLFLLRIGRSGGGWVDGVGLGICYALNALVDWHLAILLTLLLLPLAVAVLVRRERAAQSILRDLALAAALGAVLVLPLAWPLFDGMLGGAGYFQKLPEEQGIDPWFLLVPGPQHPFWGSLTSAFYERYRAYPAAGFLCYLGFVPLGLGILSVLRRQPGAALWGGIFLVSLVLALGAQLRWGGELLGPPRLPFALLAELPLLSLMRVANRFLVISSLALAVLVGLGWAALRVRSNARLLAFSSLILVEYLWLPYPIQRVELSPFYAELAASPREGAVLDIPFSANNRTVMNMVAQTVHERRIAGGYLSTRPPESIEAIRRDPVLSQLEGLDPKLSGALDREHLLALGFDTAILHKDRRRDEWERLRAATTAGTCFGARSSLTTRRFRTRSSMRSARPSRPPADRPSSRTTRSSSSTWIEPEPLRSGVERMTPIDVSRGGARGGRRGSPSSCCCRRARSRARGASRSGPT